MKKKWDIIKIMDKDWNTCFNNSYSTVALCTLDMNINDVDGMDDNFNHETAIDCLRKNVVVYQRQRTVYWTYCYWREYVWQIVWKNATRNLYLNPINFHIK
jgi:hypothetical protein